MTGRLRTMTSSWNPSTRLKIWENHPPILISTKIISRPAQILANRKNLKKTMKYSIVLWLLWRRELSQPSQPSKKKSMSWKLTLNSTNSYSILRRSSMSFTRREIILEARWRTWRKSYKASVWATVKCCRKSKVWLKNSMHSWVLPSWRSRTCISIR